MDNRWKLKLSLILFMIPALLGGCALFPDNSKEYQQAESMPDLEIPPDLTKDAVTDRMAIPGERNRTNPQRRGGTASGAAE